LELDQKHLVKISVGDMSPTDMKIRALLDKAVTSCDPPLVEEAYRLVCKLSVADSGVAPDPGKGYSSPELAVLVAEAAVELSAPDRGEDAAQQNRILMTTIADEAAKLYRSVSQVNNQVCLRLFFACLNFVLQ
jgi:hypothetical protein